MKYFYTMKITILFSVGHFLSPACNCLFGGQGIIYSIVIVHLLLGWLVLEEIEFFWMEHLFYLCPDYRAYSHLKSFDNNLSLDRLSMFICEWKTFEIVIDFIPIGWLLDMCLNITRQ